MFFKRLLNLFHAFVSFLIGLFLPNRVLNIFCNINFFAHDEFGLYGS